MFSQLGLGSAACASLARHGYDAPTPVQTEAIPLVLSGVDLLARAHTGTGKTAAFGLPTIERLLTRGGTRAPRALVLVPTRELAVQVNGGSTGVGELASAPSFSLAQNFPNPAKNGTTIRFAIPAPADVRVALYDVQGRLVRTLVDGTRAAGRHSVDWDGADDAGRRVASGVYFYRLSAGERVAERKLLMLR